MANHGRVHVLTSLTLTLSCMRPLPHCIFSNQRNTRTRSAGSLLVRPWIMSARGQAWPAGVCGEPGPASSEPCMLQTHASPLAHAKWQSTSCCHEQRHAHHGMFPV